MIESGPAPQIELSTLTGEHFSLAKQLEQGPVVLIFFKISCPTCQLTLPFLERLYAAQSAGSPHLFGVSQDKAAPTREFCEHYRIRLPVMLDPAAENYPASNAYRITNVPSLFLVESNGSVGWALNGFDKKEFEGLGRRFGHSPFKVGERVPALRPG